MKERELSTTIAAALCVIVSFGSTSRAVAERVGEKPCWEGSWRVSEDIGLDRPGATMGWTLLP